MRSEIGPVIFNNGLVRLLIPECTLMSRRLPQSVEGYRHGQKKRLLTDNCAVQIENGDTIRRRHKVGAPQVRHTVHESDDLFLV